MTIISNLYIEAAVLSSLPKNVKNLSQNWRKHPFIVMPAQAGIQKPFKTLDSGLRRNDVKSGRHRVFQF